jgi:hypothetical protein
MTLSAVPTMSSICSVWSSGALTVSVVMQRGNGGNTNDLAVSNASCSGGLKLGAVAAATFATNTQAYMPSNNTATWSTSTLTLNAAAKTLTLTLGPSCTGCANITGTPSNAYYTFTPNATMATAGAVAASGSASEWGAIF